jgi:hypothetical protein
MRARLTENLAGVGFDFAHDQLHQSRLPRSIATEQAKPFARVNLEINVVEHRWTAECMGDIEKT